MHSHSHIRFIAVILLAAMGWTCKNSIEVNQDEKNRNALVAIQLESDFLDDSVAVEFDSQTLYIGRAVTNYSVNLAWSSQQLIVSTGIHAVRVMVFGSNITSEIFAYVKDTTIVTANYDRQNGQLIFRTYDHFIPRR